MVLYCTELLVYLYMSNKQTEIMNQETLNIGMVAFGLLIIIAISAVFIVNVIKMQIVW